MNDLARTDALIDEIHDSLRATLGIESAAALSLILGALRGDDAEVREVALLTRPLVALSRGDASIASAVAERVLDRDSRRLAGLYPTPRAVTELAARLLGLTSPSRVLDPACGAGAFLAPFRGRGHSLVGIDRNPQLIELSRHALGEGTLRVGDALAPLGSLGLSPASFDAIVLNPPFGVRVDASTARRFTWGGSGRAPSEVLFLERAAELLRPGGRLAAIVPASFFTNRGLARARELARAALRLALAVELPPEAFMRAGARTSAVLMLAQRRGAPTTLGREGEVLTLRARDAGHDRRGRHLEVSDLARVREEAERFLEGTIEGTRVAPGGELDAVLRAPARAPRRERSERLEDVCAAVRLGKTPPKSAYAERGRFIVKVGNLTGHGLDFTPRDRNFVTEEYARATLGGRVGAELTLAPGDLLVTASAHARRYIAEKVDLVEGFPPWIEGPVFYVGELLLLRPRDPDAGLDLLGYLRSARGKQALRALARGQTAHLLPRDVRALTAPATPNVPAARELRAGLRREAQLALDEARRRRAIDDLANALHGDPTDD